MPTKSTEATSALTEAIVSGVKQSQELAFNGITAWVDLTGKAFTAPNTDALPFVESLPNPRDMIESSFGLFEELLATQKEFAIKVVDAVGAKSA